MAKTKSKFDIEQLRRAGEIAAQIVERLSQELKPGVSAGELNRMSGELCKEYGVEPAFFGYQDYKYFICIAVNDEVVHAIPYDTKIFQEGDLVKLDFGVKYRGYYSDHCRTFAVGSVNEIHERLLKVGEEATMNAVALCKTGNRIGDLSYAMQSTAEKAGFSVVKMYIGHGIGKKLHEDPEVPAFGQPGTGPMLQEGMVICVECQVCEKKADITHDRDGWTSRTKDGGYVVMFEHMVSITEQGPDILTLLPSVA
jgi:methionyl aminopeptidase